MRKDLKFYEQRAVTDKEYPIELGHKWYDKNKGFRAHWHEDIEIHYIIKGELDVIHDHQAYTVKEGDLLIANSNVLHEGSVKGDGVTEVLNIILNLEALSKKLADRNVMFQRIISKDPVICTLMEQLCKEYVDKEPEYRLMCKGIVTMLLGHLSRHYIEKELTKKENSKRVQRLERLRPVMVHIEKHYAEEIRNRDLAELLHLSEDRFNHLFKECIGVSPLQYMNKIRMEKAMYFLKTRQYSATEVASMVGIPNYIHFARLFQKTYGCTPGHVLKIDLGMDTKE